MLKRLSEHRPGGISCLRSPKNETTGQNLLLRGLGVGVVELWRGYATNAREAAEEGCARELGWAGPAGEVKRSVGVSRTGFIDGMVLDEFVKDDATHAGLLLERGTLPIETEALTANVALNVLLLF